MVFDPLCDGISSIELEAIHGTDLDICNGARVSYGKKIDTFGDNDRKLIAYLIKHQHTSPLEHNMIRFRIRCPIFVARQWMRHRVGVSYNEISYRYAKAKGDFYIPEKWRYQDTNNKQGSTGEFQNPDLTLKYKDIVEQCVQFYEAMIELGVCREQARGILPVSLYTEFIFTCNLNSLFHFVKLRISSEAQYEIRQYAKFMINAVKDNFPVAIEEWKKYNCINDF